MTLINSGLAQTLPHDRKSEYLPRFREPFGGIPVDALTTKKQPPLNLEAERFYNPWRRIKTCKVNPRRRSFPAYRGPTMSRRGFRLKRATRNARALAANSLKRPQCSRRENWSCKMSNGRQKQPKQPNAFKHGVFSRTTIVPGEDSEEFEALYSELIQEWMPDGATEEDAVLSIAKAIWRKRRAQRFLEIQLTKNTMDPSHASYDEQFGLNIFMGFLRADPVAAFKEYASRCLRVDKVELLKSKFPRSNYESSEEWANALINEIESVLLMGSVLEDHPFAKLGSLFLSAATFTDDFFDQELRLDERLEIMIDRAVKRLIQTKAIKQMLGQTGAERMEDRVRKIDVKKAANG
jgi:hypothetical protein